MFFYFIVFCLFVCLFVYLQEQRRTLTKTGITDVYLSLKEVSRVRLQYSVVVEQVMHGYKGVVLNLLALQLTLKYSYRDSVVQED